MKQLQINLAFYKKKKNILGNKKISEGKKLDSVGL